MSVVASEFQAVMDVVRVWWQESFEALKVHGQHALCEHERADETLAYVSVYCSQTRRGVRQQECVDGVSAAWGRAYAHIGGAPFVLLSQGQYKNAPLYFLNKMYDLVL